MKYKIEKNTVQETLIIPLYSRKLCPNIYRDETAVCLLDQIDYDFSEAEKNSHSLMQRFGALEVAMRHLCINEGTGAVRPDPCPVPSGLYHERGRRRDKFCATVYPCLRWTLLRLWVQKEMVMTETRCSAIPTTLSFAMVRMGLCSLPIFPSNSFSFADKISCAIWSISSVC